MLVRPTGGKVLIAEPTAVLAGAMASRLSRASVDVRISRSSSEVLQWVSEWDFDVAVLDAALSNEGAAGVCRRIRATSRDCSVLVWAEPEDPLEAVCCYDAGADDYFAKGLDLIVIEAKVRRALLRAQDRISGSLESNRDSGTHDLRDRVHVEVPGVDVRRLTRLEERLLSILSRARGGLVRSDDIILNLWAGSSVESRALYEHVSTLRAKLQELGWTIVNVRGQGYKLARDEVSLASERHASVLAVSQDTAPDSWQSTG